MTPQQYFDLVIPTVDMSIRSELYHTNEFNFAVAVILSDARDAAGQRCISGYFRAGAGLLRMVQGREAANLPILELKRPGTSGEL